jgi:hypothetical protein
MKRRTFLLAAAGGLTTVLAGCAATPSQTLDESLAESTVVRNVTAEESTLVFTFEAEPVVTEHVYDPAAVGPKPGNPTHPLNQPMKNKYYDRAVFVSGLAAFDDERERLANGTVEGSTGRVELPTTHEEVVRAGIQVTKVNESAPLGTVEFLLTTSRSPDGTLNVEADGSGFSEQV